MMPQHCRPAGRAGQALVLASAVVPDSARWYHQSEARNDRAGGAIEAGVGVFVASVAALLGRPTTGVLVERVARHPERT
jgi:hypothetical protein